MLNHERILYGSLIGDALGVPVEFRSREDSRRNPVRVPRQADLHRLFNSFITNSNNNDP